MNVFTWSTPFLAAKVLQMINSIFNKGLDIQTNSEFKLNKNESEEAVKHNSNSKEIIGKEEDKKSSLINRININ